MAEWECPHCGGLLNPEFFKAIAVCEQAIEDIDNADRACTSQNPHTPCHSSCQALKDAMDICRRVDKYFNYETQSPTGTLEAIYTDAGIIANKGKGGTIGGDRDSETKSKKHGAIKADCKTCKYGVYQIINRDICRECSDTGDKWEAIENQYCESCQTRLTASRGEKLCAVCRGGR